MLPSAIAAIMLHNKSPQTQWLKTIINRCQLRVQWAWSRIPCGSSLLHVSLNPLEPVGSLGHALPMERTKLRGQVPLDRHISSLGLLHSCCHPSGQRKSHGETQHRWDAKTYATRGQKETSQRGSSSYLLKRFATPST